MIGLIIDQALIVLAGLIIFFDVRRQGRKCKVFWLWLFAIAMGYFILQIIGVAAVFTLYMVWGRNRPQKRKD